MTIHPSSTQIAQEHAATPRRSRLMSRQSKTFRQSFWGALALFIALIGFSPLADAAAVFLKVANPIKDSADRTLVIVDFLPKAHEAYPGAIPAAVPVVANTFKFFHNPKVERLVSDYERRYQFERVAMTSWVGSSVAAYLADAQIERLLQDPNVKQISQDSFQQLSAPPPWNDFNTGMEIYSWGRFAVNGKVASSSSSRKIYVVDSGVAYHTDFGAGQVTRTNVSCPTGAAGSCESETIGAWTSYPVIGCYGHATHVAGIIAAPVNSHGTAGVYAGAKIISLNVTRALFSAASGELCSSPYTLTNSALGNALDHIMQQTLYDTKMSIVNISTNSAGMGISSSGIPEPNWSKVVTLATPVYRYDVGRQYHGAFVAQSAGNGARPVNGFAPLVPSDACLWNSNGAPVAYRPLAYAPYSVDYDGIMVVGAINKYSGAAIPFSANSIGVNSGPGSNYGRCIDIWAPGDAIWSLWGNIPETITSNGIYSNVAQVSGTSMAAPHVAAAAAYLADVEGLTTPAAVEQRIRQLSQQFYGTTDPLSPTIPIMVLQLP
ncbi:MAG: S8 family serine peptidase [Burkholderiales bacterium]|nr:S8 family serine peptidase [Burkholderiales bacterium]